MTALNSAQRSVDVCVFCVTADEIASILCRLNDRGVVVKVITDSEQVHSTGSVVQTLRSCGKKWFVAINECYFS